MSAFSVDREKVLEEFEKYVEQYDKNDKRITLKEEHTLRVASLCDEIADSLLLTHSNKDLAWLIGILHDIGRFEQIRTFGTLEDAKSVKHAHLSVQILFDQRFLSKFCNIDSRDVEYEIIRQAILYHSDYKLPDDLDEQFFMFCNIIRDADKIDILKVVYETEPEIIYGVSMEELMNQVISENVMKCFDEKHAVLRSMRESSVDNLVGYASFVYELIYNESKRLVDKQGYIWKILDFVSNICKENEKIRYMKTELGRYLKE